MTDSSSKQSKKEQFLAAAGDHYTVSEISAATGISRSSHYDWLKSDPDYGRRFNEQRQDATTKHCDEVVREIVRRGTKGVVKPVYQGGKRVGRIRQYSDTLLIFHAKAVMPKLYNPQCITPEQLADSLVRYSDALLEAVPTERQAETREKLLKMAIAITNGEELVDEFRRVTEDNQAAQSNVG